MVEDFAADLVWIALAADVQDDSRMYSGRLHEVDP